MSRPSLSVRACASFMLLVSAIFGIAEVAHGQQSDGIAEYLTINDSEVFNGAIIVLTEEGYALSFEPYNNDMFGVATTNPAVAWSRVPKTGTTAVVSQGTTAVQVSNANGAIIAGDWITSSSEAGVGMKATQPGVVLGRALSALPEGQEIGYVSVTIAPQFAAPEQQNGIPLNPRAAWGTLRSGFSVATSGAANFSVRYSLAVLALLLALAFAFWIFSRTATNSVAAVGRNPLARKSIMFVAVVNVIMALVIAVTGLVLALIMLAV